MLHMSFLPPGFLRTFLTKRRDITGRIQKTIVETTMDFKSLTMLVKGVCMFNYCTACSVDYFIHYSFFMYLFILAKCELTTLIVWMCFQLPNMFTTISGLWWKPGKHIFSKSLSKIMLKNSRFELTDYSSFVFLVQDARQWNCATYLWKILSTVVVLSWEKKGLLITIFPNMRIIFLHMYVVANSALCSNAESRLETLLSHLQPMDHRFNAGGLNLLQMWQNDVCMGHDTW